MFSILDIQDADDGDYPADEEGEEGEEGEKDEDRESESEDVDEPLNIRPLRVSFTITKVRLFRALPRLYSVSIRIQLSGKRLWRH